MSKIDFDLWYLRYLIYVSNMYTAPNLYTMFYAYWHSWIFLDNMICISIHSVSFILGCQDWCGKKLMAVDRPISKADQLRPQHPWITTCWKLGVGKYTLGASQNYKSSSQNLLERLDFLWVFLAGPESREQRDGNNWLETRRQQTVNSGIFRAIANLKILRSLRRLSWKSLSFCSSKFACKTSRVKCMRKQPEYGSFRSQRSMNKKAFRITQWPSKNMGLVGYPVDRQLFFSMVGVSTFKETMSSFND